MKGLQLFAIPCILFVPPSIRADVGDPQIRTDHVWYPGELACSTFERLFATEAEAYRRVVGVTPTTDEQKVLAAWLWRNTHYAHGEEGAADLWGQGFGKGIDGRNREYWTGLFAHGFGLCGTTHSQWVAEMEALLGHSRGRGVGTAGHNSFEVFLGGGPYKDGKWVLLDHDISTIVFDKEGKALLSIPEVKADWKQWTKRSYFPDKQHGWLVCGLHPDDGGVYAQYDVAEYLAGYAGPPPMVHLRRGETLRRYQVPGLADGKTFAFWGRNYNTSGIPGPERAHTWVNQPDKMHGSRDGAGYHPGQARYGNAVYMYRPDFAGSDYKEGAIAEDEKQVTFEFYTPYVIAATPPNDKPWGIYDPGCKNGLVLHGKADCAVSLSTDQGKTWQDCGRFADGLDLTDRVKGRQQYLLRFHAGAKSLATAGVTITTVCQANPAVMPRLKDDGCEVHFAASYQAVVSAGPSLDQARAHLVEGQMPSPRVTLEVAAPRGQPVVAIHAAAHVNSSSPPQPDVKYQIEVSADGGKSWQSMVKNWTIPRRGDEPKDFWSQSMCWGSLPLPEKATGPVRIRFSNNGGKNYARCEAHLVYTTAGADSTKVTFAWTDDKGEHQADHLYSATNQEPAWKIPTSKNVRTKWVEFAAVAAKSK
jgi:hypothetical protein